MTFELAQVNISRLLAPLEEFVDAHRAVLRGRRKWFQHPAEAMTALWWVPRGHRPSVAEAEERLVHLRSHGPSSWAFTLKQTYGATSA